MSGDERIMKKRLKEQLTVGKSLFTCCGYRKKTSSCKKGISVQGRKRSKCYEKFRESHMKEEGEGWVKFSRILKNFLERCEQDKKRRKCEVDKRER